jgi:hypothetical protein
VSSSQFDPTETLASPDENALDTGFCDIKALALAAKMPSPEFEVGHAAPWFYYATRRCGGGMALGCASAAIWQTADWIFERQVAH